MDFDDTLFENGKLRLRRARDYFVSERRGLKFDDLGVLYNSWREFDEYILLQHHVFDKRKGMRKNTVAVKCNKRGNDVYFYRLEKKLSSFWMRKDIDYFEVRGNAKFCGMLFCTLTYEKGIVSVSDAWEGIGKDFNKWITALRQRFGKISYVRCWESFKNGYPHIHCLLYFHEVSFRVIRMYSNAKKRLIYRVVNVKPISDGMKERWKDFIPETDREVKEMFELCYHSFVDVEGCESFNTGIYYITKYMTKFNISVLTLSLCWLFQKRSYSISRSFYDLITAYMSISNRRKRIQVSLADLLFRDTIKIAQIYDVWVFIGIYSGDLLDIRGDVWSCKVDLNEFDIYEREGMQPILVRKF